MNKLTTQAMLKAVIARLAQECAEPSNGDINRAALLAALARNLKGCLSAYSDYRKNTVK